MWDAQIGEPLEHLLRQGTEKDTSLVLQRRMAWAVLSSTVAVCDVFPLPLIPQRGSLLPNTPLTMVAVQGRFTLSIEPISGTLIL